MSKLSFNEPFDCEKLIDMKSDQLDFLIKECEINIEHLRINIVKTYQQAQPYLIQLTTLKRQLKQTTEKMEAAKTFLSMENNGSLVSNIEKYIQKSHQQTDNNIETTREYNNIKQSNTISEKHTNTDQEKHIMIQQRDVNTSQQRDANTSQQRDVNTRQQREDKFAEKSNDIIEEKIVHTDSTKFRSPLVDNWKHTEKKRIN